MGHRILVIEDSAVIRRLIEVCLRAADLEIITRDDGKSGLAAVRESRPISWCSTSASRHGRLEVSLVRSDESIRDTPVVVLTATPKRSRAGAPTRAAPTPS